LYGILPRSRSEYFVGPRATATWFSVEPSSLLRMPIGQVSPPLGLRFTRPELPCPMFCSAALLCCFCILIPQKAQPRRLIPDGTSRGVNVPTGRSYPKLATFLWRGAQRSVDGLWLHTSMTWPCLGLGRQLVRPGTYPDNCDHCYVVMYQIQTLTEFRLVTIQIVATVAIVRSNMYQWDHQISMSRRGAAHTAEIWEQSTTTAGHVVLPAASSKTSQSMMTTPSPSAVSRTLRSVFFRGPKCEVS
jgi:hypothetical protein